jgi:hypothetical protein
VRLGDKVTAKGTIRRTGDYVPHGRDRAYWVPVVWKEPRTGVFIGWRNLSNGEIEHASYDEGAIYHPKEHFKVALVVFSERTNPQYVTLDTIITQPANPAQGE